MSQERIEAAAKVGYERNVEHLVSFGFATSWEAAHHDTRVEVLAKTEAQLAAADAVMFSDEAIERAAKAMEPTAWEPGALWFCAFGQTHEEAREAFQRATIARVRAVVAALKGEQ